jgi:hypothetical protein
VRRPNDPPIAVAAPDGAKWSVGTATVAGPMVTAPVTPSAPPAPTH